MDIILKDKYKNIGGGVGFFRVLRIGHRWSCGIGECAAARILLVVSNNLYLLA